MTKKGFFSKNDYAYDEYYDCYICPNDKILKYSTTNRDGYHEYKSNPADCQNCPLIKQCTTSKNHQKVISRHVWQDSLDYCEDVRHSDLRYWYDKRKEILERPKNIMDFTILISAAMKSLRRRSLSLLCV